MKRWYLEQKVENINCDAFPGRIHKLLFSSWITYFCLAIAGLGSIFHFVKTSAIYNRHCILYKVVSKVYTLKSLYTAACQLYNIHLTQCSFHCTLHVVHKAIVKALEQHYEANLILRGQTLKNEIT